MTCRSLLVGVVVVVAAALPVLAAPPLVIDLASYPDAFRIESTSHVEFGLRTVACDVNGDGVEDLVIGDHLGDGPGGGSGPRGGAGNVHVVFGRRGAWRGAAALSSLQRVLIIGQEARDHLGWGVACGDVDGDGFDDIVACAPEAKSLSNERGYAGQCHLVRGGPSLPDLIDLLGTPGTVFYGAVAHDMLGEYGPAIGDLNGDGIADIAFDAYLGTKGSAFQAGKLHVMFGRAGWAPSYDLLTESDVTIQGADGLDQLGSANPVIGRVDHDAIADLVVGAPQADAPGNARDMAGEVYVLRGRAHWPATIDLAMTAADETLYGKDVSDRIGWDQGLALGDIDGNGSLEVIAGSRPAAGPLDDHPWRGEVRTFTPGSTMPPLVDLGTRSASVIYGSTDVQPEFGYWVRTGDVNGDGTTDLVIAAPGTDGPDGTRIGAGSVAVFFGRNPFPAQLDVSAGDENWLIHGARASDALVVLTTVDLNGDGVKELALLPSRGSSAAPTSVWLVAPVDTDGDGIPNIADDCPLVADPGQLDSVGDGRGDACRTDWDGDGIADASECAPADPHAATPPEVAGLRFAGASRTRLAWTASPFSSTYDITRGVAPLPAPADYGTCQNARDANRTDTQFNDADVPGRGRAFTYLVRGNNAVCGAGTWGRTTAGDERVNANAGACP